MTGNEYQKLAARTINMNLTKEGCELHALHGMAFATEHAKKEVGDLLWFIAEYCTAMGWKLDDVMQLNIEKLRTRFPDGFDPERSLHRKAGDV